jgi:hypothetical protein
MHCQPNIIFTKYVYQATGIYNPVITDKSVEFEPGCPLCPYPTLLLTCRHILLGRPGGRAVWSQRCDSFWRKLWNTARSSEKGTSRADESNYYFAERQRKLTNEVPWMKAHWVEFPIVLWMNACLLKRARLLSWHRAVCLSHGKFFVCRFGSVGSEY